MRQKPLQNYLPQLSPVIRFIRMDTVEPAWAFRSASIFRRILDLDAAVDTYRGGVAGGFNVPDDAKHLWRIDFDGMTESLDVRLNKTHAYVYAFETRELGDDGHPHPERGFRLTLAESAQWDALMKAVKTHLGIGSYPAWQPDSAFTRQRMTSPVKLRCVPRTDNNMPLIVTAQELLVTEPIYPPGKPTWRQGRLGGVTHWLEPQ